VDWGPHGGHLHLAAVAAGVWRLGDRVETAGFFSGFDSLISDGSAPDAGAWSLATNPTPGAANPDCSTLGDCRENRCFDGLDDDGDTLVDCDDDDCAPVVGCAGRIVLNELHFGDGTAQAPGWFEITNRGLATAQIEGWQVCAGDACYAIGEGELDPGDFLAFVPADGTDTDNTVFTGDMLGTWSASGGSLSLYGGDGSIDVANAQDHVGWGSGATATEDIAVEAGQWFPDDTLATDGLATPRESALRRRRRRRVRVDDRDRALVDQRQSAMHRAGHLPRARL
jgi:hypothetical protein